MTELTIDQALQKGIQAHKDGQVQEANRLYTAILRAQPKHPDANHNMGVLAVGIGKVEQALPFFKIALEANPATAQFWLSYIDALIKLERLADAKAVLDQAKSKGAKGDGFDKLEQRLKEVGQEPLEANQIASEPQPKLPNILDTLKLDQAISLAKKKAKAGDPGEGKRIYQDILTKFPKNKRAIDGLKGLAVRPVGKASKVQNPPQDQLQTLIALYSQGQLQQALKQAETLVQQFPQSASLFNIQGAVLKGLGQLDQSIEAYNKALAIKPDNANTHYNKGIIYKAQGRLENAIKAFRKAIAIKPNYSEAYNNMGNALRDQYKLNDALEAFNKALAISPISPEIHYNNGITLKKKGMLADSIKAYQRAISIKPDYAFAYNNMANVLTDQGKLDRALWAYKKTLDINPRIVEAVENSFTIITQLSYTDEYWDDFYRNNNQTVPEAITTPKLQILHAIQSFLQGDFKQAYAFNQSFETRDPNSLTKLTQKNQIFCNTYNNFLRSLLESATDNSQSSFSENESLIYHLGESHCLSYAHRIMHINGYKYRITPKITFGAKAFHFCDKKYNIFQAITEANFGSLPEHSKVLLSFGEIDCRLNEGFLTAAQKLKTPIDQLIEETIVGYIGWFYKKNKGYDHKLYILNIPAPVYNTKATASLNYEVAKTVALFNVALKKHSRQHGFDVVDVFKFTSDAQGFSNGIFHVDNIHLGPKAVTEIEQQLL